MSSSGLDQLVDRPSRWLSEAGPNADLVLSTRVRLARNLRDVPFTQRAAEEEMGIVVSRVVSACQSSPSLAGGDFLIGGAGIDTADYSAAFFVTVDLNRQVAFTSAYYPILPADKTLADFQQKNSDAQGDLLSGFENISGGGDNDTLTGDKGNNVIWGNGGRS